MVSSAQVSVGTAATLLVAADPDAQSVWVRNRGAASVFVGPSDVTTGTGFELSAGDSLSVSLLGGEALYGIVAAASQPVHVLRVSVG